MKTNNNADLHLLQKKLEEYINKIKLNINYRKQAFLPFPCKKNLDKIEINLAILVEQAEKLIQASTRQEKEYLGIITEPEDIQENIKILIDDIEMFATKHNLNYILAEYSRFGQTKMPSYTIFRLSHAKLLPLTYKKNIELLEQDSLLEIYSIPFLVRLSIELKIKAMIGFKSLNKINIKGNMGIKITQSTFPTSNVIRFLKKSKIIDSPLNLNDIGNIYSWACNFIHTGNKEYLWMSLKAIDMLGELFSREKDKYLCKPINYLKDDISLSTLEKMLTDSTEINPKGKNYKLEFELDQIYFDETANFWDKRRSSI